MKLICLAAIATVLVGSAFADGLKSDIAKKYAAIDRSLKTKDVKSFGNLMASCASPGFKMTVGQHSENYSQMVAEMKQELAAMSSMTSVSTKIDKFVTKGGKVMVYSYRSMSGNMVGQDKKNHKIWSGGSTVDTWIKTSKGWKLDSMVWGAMKQTMDGKPMAGGS